MKRPKVDLSGNGIKDFFFQHGEKLFFGIACLLILLFFWMGFKTEEYDRTSPVAMSNTAEQARDYITRADSWERIKDFRQADNEAVAKIENDEGLDMDTYVFSSRISGSAVKTLAYRTDPQLLAPKDLEAKFFRAQLALSRNANTGRELRRGVDELEDSELSLPPMYKYEQFVYRPEGAGAGSFEISNAIVGMAIMPHEVQQTAYDNIFQFSRNYDAIRDVPRYLFLEVQRKNGEDGEWESITEHVHTAVGLPDSPTAEAAKNVSNPDYLVDGISMKVPPFLGIDYRPYAMHPDVPMREVVTGEETEGDSKDDSNRDSGSVFDNRPDPDDEVEQVVVDETTKKNKAPVRLVRFYDLTPKEIGQSYQYRVRVWLADPNDPKSIDAAKTASTGFTAGLGRGGGPGGGGFAADDDSSGATGGGDRGAGGGTSQLPEKDPEPLNWSDLAATVRNRINKERDDLPDLENETFRTAVEEILKHAVPTPWSEPSNQVTVTSGFESFVTGPIDQPPMAPARGGTFPQDEPAAKVVVSSFQDDLGVGVPAETEAYRGSVLNFDAATYVLHPIRWNIKEVNEGVDNRGNKIGRRFETDAIVVDMMGGERQPFSKRNDVMTAPGDVLIMDRNGNFIIRNDLEDQMAYRHAMFISESNERLKEESTKRGGDEEDDQEGDGRGR